MLRLELPLPAPVLSPNARPHWAQVRRASREAKDMVVCAVLEQGHRTEPLTHATVTVTFVAGYGSAATDVPSVLREAVKMLTAHYYEFRQPVISGTIATKIPMHIESLIWIHRVLEAA